MPNLQEDPIPMRPPPTPNGPDIEVNPGEIGNNTEVDLDNTRINTDEDHTHPEKSDLIVWSNSCKINNNVHQEGQNGQ